MFWSPVFVTIDSPRGPGYANLKDSCQSKARGRSQIIRPPRAFGRTEHGHWDLGERAKHPAARAAGDRPAPSDHTIRRIIQGMSSLGAKLAQRRPRLLAISMKCTRLPYLRRIDGFVSGAIDSSAQPPPHTTYGMPAIARARRSPLSDPERPSVPSLLARRRNISCTSCHCHRGREHFGRLLRCSAERTWGAKVYPRRRVPNVAC